MKWVVKKTSIGRNCSVVNVGKEVSTCQKESWNTKGMYTDLCNFCWFVKQLSIVPLIIPSVEMSFSSV